MKKYFIYFVLFLMASLAFAQSQTYIVLDPMHGGKDPGARGKCKTNGKTISVEEKDVALKISKQVYTRLQKESNNTQIFLTRDKDVFCSKQDRLKSSKENTCGNSSLYISIGCGASIDTSKSGFIVYLPSVGRNNFRLASAISEGLSGKIGVNMENLGLAYKQNSASSSTSIIVEIGFLSNDADAKLLSQDEFIKKCSDGIFEGIKYFLQTKKNPGG